jgi:outer membrane immunogenic protein
MIYRRCDNAATVRRDARPMSRLCAFTCRLAFCALMAAVTAGPAAAGDWFDGSGLRGSYSGLFNRPPSAWEGINLGATVGYTGMNTDFGNANSSEVNYILRNTLLEQEYSPSGWTTLPNASAESNSWGGFLGYSWQTDELVLGADLTYNHVSNLQSSASDSIDRIVTTSDSYKHDVNIVSSAYIKLKDYGTVRARAGYAFGQFLPYAFLGVAVGRFDYASSATVTDAITPPSPATPYTFGPQTQSNGKTNQYQAGFDGGLGIDVAVLPNVFVRGEWEYIAFASIDGIRTNINTFRAGVGVRF